MDRHLAKTAAFGETYGFMSGRAEGGAVEPLTVGTTIPQGNPDSFITVDYSLIALKVMGQLASEESKARQLKWDYVKRFPGFLGYNRLRKSRARMMVEAVRPPGFTEKGNVGIDFEKDEGGADVFIFFYRGTRIAKWYPVENVYTDIPCPFDDTPSTRNQRKMAREAVEEFNKAVFG